MVPNRCNSTVFDENQVKNQDYINSVHPWGGHIIFAFFPAVCRPPSGVTLRFRSFQGKLFILSLPNLVWVFIGLIACMGLLLVKIAL